MMLSGVLSIKKPHFLVGLFSSWFWINNFSKSISKILQAVKLKKYNLFAKRSGNLQLQVVEQPIRVV